MVDYRLFHTHRGLFPWQEDPGLTYPHGQSIPQCQKVPITVMNTCDAVLLQRDAVKHRLYASGCSHKSGVVKYCLLHFEVLCVSCWYNITVFGPTSKT